MHDVGEPLHLHHFRDLDGTGVADAADVVASEVQEHDVLGALFFAALELSLVGRILTRR